LRIYLLEFGFEQIFKHFTYSTQPTIYINTDVDRVCIMNHPSLAEPEWGYPELLQKCATNGTRMLAIRVDEYSAGFYRDVSTWLSSMMEEVMFFAAVGRPNRRRPVGNFLNEADINDETFMPTLYGVQNRALNRSNILSTLKRYQRAVNPALVVKLGYHTQRPANVPPTSM
jgi:hypothetical protein